MSRDALERLAVAQALYKELGAITSTGNPYSLRGMCDEELRADFEEDGTDRRRITLNGVEVGKLSVKVTKPGKPKAVQVDIAKSATWLREQLEERPDWLLCWLGARSTEIAQACLDATGEVPDGYEVRRDMGGEFAGTTLTGCTAERVQAATGVLLQSEVLALLEGGE